MIQPYGISFYPNSKIWPGDTNSSVVVSVAYLLKACINHYYHGMRVLLHKTEGLVKLPIVYLIHINYFMTHNKHMVKSESDMAMETMCAYP